MLRSFYYFLLYFFVFLVIILVSSEALYAQNLTCGQIDVEGLETKCIDTKFDAATGPPHIVPASYADKDYGEFGQYYKCLDTVGGCGAEQRCCVAPLPGQYGGKCFNPTQTRESLGIGSENRGVGMDFLRPQNCDIPPDTVVEGGKPIIIELVDGAFTSQTDMSVENINKLINAKPPQLEIGNSKGGAVTSTVIQVRRCPPIVSTLTPCFDRNEDWIYETQNGEDPDGRKAFFITDKDGDFFYDSARKATTYKSFFPSDPRGSGWVVDTAQKTGCLFANAIKSPFFAAVGSIARRLTNAESIPDIALLCAKGTPVFADPNTSLVVEAGSNKVTIKDVEGCRCTDSSSGPANTAVLMCTRFITGASDNVSWRYLIPNPQFTMLLSGIMTSSSNIQELRAGVKKDYNDFFSTSNDANFKAWIKSVHDITQTVSFSNSDIVRSRLFGTKYRNTRLSGTESNENSNSIDARKDNSVIDDISTVSDQMHSNFYVKEYISCLSCAKYGGFHSALGCLPMDKVDRFFSEGIIGYGITFAGAICLLCVLYGSLLYQISAGEPTRIQKAQKLITGCLLGFLAIVFSIFILRFVGVDLLRIPGLS